MRILHQYMAIFFFAFLVPSVIVATITWVQVERIGQEAADRSAAVLEEQAPARLEALVREEAAQIDHRLGLIENDVVDLQQRYLEIHAVPEALGSLPRENLYPRADTLGLPGLGYLHPEHDAWADFDRRGQGSPWIPRPVIRRAQQDPALLASLGRQLLEMAALDGWLASLGRRHQALLDLVWIVLHPGISNAWPAYNYVEIIREKPEIVDINELDEDYVRLVNPSNDPERELRWLDPYFDRFRGVWMTSCVAPLYEGDRFLGSVGMDILLPVITRRVLDLHPTDEGYAFLMARDGRPIAMPEPALRELVPDPTEAEALSRSFQGDPTVGQDPRLKDAMGTARLGSSQPGALSDLVTAMGVRGATGTARLELDAVDRLISYASIPSTGWTMGVVVSRAELLRPTLPIRAAIEAGSRDVSRQFNLFGCVLVLSSVLAGVLLHRSTIRPLERLSRTMEALRWNRLELPVWDRRRKDEIGLLYTRFAAMIDMLREVRAEGEASRLALNDEKELLAVTLRSIGDAVLSTDALGRVRLMNPVAEQLTGWTEGEADGRALEEVFVLVDDDKGEALHSPLQRLSLPEQSESVGRTVLISRSGERRRIWESAAPIRDSEQGIIGVVIVFRDMTVRLRVEEEMSRIQKIESVGVLAAGIAHDFNNLLAVIGGNLSILEGRLGASAGLQRFVEAGQRGVVRARDLTVQLLTFARGGAPVRAVVDLGPVISEAVQFAVRGSGLQSSVDIEPRLSAAAVDPNQIARVVQNLCLNAVQATGGQGLLRVAARNIHLGEGERPPLAAGRYVEVSLEDDGPGIPADQISRIFEPYYTTRKEGSGLGLAVSFSILRRHEGFIEVSSAVGAGATFRFWLPATEDLPPAPSLPPPPITRGGGRLLLLEDDLPVQEMLVEVLGSLGYSVTAVGEGSQAITAFTEAIADSQPFHAVILDLTVPGGLGGREVIGVLRRIDPSVRAIVSSGYSSDPILAEPRRFGFHAALPKPCSVRLVASTVAVVLGMEPLPPFG